MTADTTIYVFHIRKPDSQALFLHPFENFEKIISKGGVINIEGRYGQEPAVESLTSFRNSLYRIVEESVNRWIAESRFIPRFLTSAAVFMFVYFFLSFAIRDPLPMADEIIAGFAAAVLVYFLLGKKYRLTGTASKLRAHYRGIVDRVVFTESSFSIAAENLMASLRGNNIDKMIEILENSNDEVSTLQSDLFSEERGQFLSYVERELKKQLSSKQKKIISRILSGNMLKNNALIKELDLLEMTGNIDIHLFLVYLKLR